MDRQWTQLADIQDGVTVLPHQILCRSIVFSSWLHLLPLLSKISRIGVSAYGHAGSTLDSHFIVQNSWLLLRWYDIISSPFVLLYHANFLLILLSARAGHTRLVPCYPNKSVITFRPASNVTLTTSDSFPTKLEFTAEFCACRNCPTSPYASK